jgi:preprotein translocase subunit SecB
VLGQYVKDFSFENPNAPRSLGQNQTQPGINVGINVALVQLAATDFEVALKIEGKAEAAARSCSRSS